MLAWFRDICDTDRDAALIFPSSLSKDQRAAIHTLVQAVGLGALASVSKGVGENRHITVVRLGQEDSTSQVSTVSPGIYTPAPRELFTCALCVKLTISTQRGLCIVDSTD